MLLNRFWGFDQNDGGNVLDVYVGRLRRKLGEPVLIHTVFGVGYVLKEEEDDIHALAAHLMAFGLMIVSLVVSSIVSYEVLSISLRQEIDRTLAERANHVAEAIAVVPNRPIEELRRIVWMNSLSRRVSADYKCERKGGFPFI